MMTTDGALNGDVTQKTPASRRLANHQPQRKSSALRTDLLCLVDRRVGRHWTLIDELTGRVTRLSFRDYWRLNNQTDGPESADESPSPDECVRTQNAVSQATAAGILRNRMGGRPRIAALPLRLLAIRLPLFNADGMARWLAARIGTIFSPAAIALGALFISCMFLSILAGWPRLQTSFANVIADGRPLSATGGMLGFIFLATKAIHEAAHAVACRVVGAPVRDCGIFFFCGIPCPFVDVSEVWRNDSRLQRAAVMFAGIYVEWLLAAGAIAVWWVSDEASTQWLCINLMMVCGISTLVFNANPLVRMDGYFVVSDLMGVPNLRNHASRVFQSVIMDRFYGLPSAERLQAFDLFWVIYHAASSAYRIVVTAAIVAVLFALFVEWNLWWIGFSILLSLVTLLIYRALQRTAATVCGQDRWAASPWWRRTIVSCGTWMVLILALFLPHRRTVDVSGVIDYQDVVEVHALAGGQVSQVHYEFGEEVKKGDLLVELQDDQTHLQWIHWRARRVIANLESDFSRRVSLQENGARANWEVEDANRNAAETQCHLASQRISRLQLKAPVDGLIVPPVHHAVRTDLRLASNVRHTSRFSARPETSDSLRARRGSHLPVTESWCRIASTDRTCVVVHVDAAERQNIKIGNPVKILMQTGDMQQMALRVDKIEEIVGAAPVTYRICCNVPGESLHHDFAEDVSSAATPPMLVGGMVEGRICFETETIGHWIWRSIHEALRG